MKKPRFLIALILPLLTVINAYSQKDTAFWFVAPEISYGTSFTMYDQPVAFQFSTYDLPAVIRVSQPANPFFTDQILLLPAYSGGKVQFPPQFDEIENKPANQVLNKGFLIESTSPITAYYEIIGKPSDNPELFSLKGRNALGTYFFIPFQNILNNSNDYIPSPHAAFDIVATENNTTVTITPTQSIVGHAANLPFSIKLNRGQTYSAEASSQAATAHPAGSKVTSDKLIAVTIKDDLLDGSTIFGGFCDDVIGDQLVPIDKLGTKYVVHKGHLNGTESAFVVATSAGTSIAMDGVVKGSLNAGQTLELPIDNGSHFIESSAPIYLLQMTGISCEVAGEILPDLNCSGSYSIRFVRSTDEEFYLFLVTNSGNESGFLLNGNSNLITSGSFQSVPGSNGQFVSAVLPFSTFQVPTGQSSIVENNLGAFHMGFLNGGGTTGCRFGFFSDFGNQINRDTILMICPGESLSFNGIHITGPGIYFDTILNSIACDTILKIEIKHKQFVTKNDQITLCAGDTIRINNLTISQPGIYVDTLLNVQGCDTVVTILANINAYITRQEILNLCLGDTLWIGNNLITKPGILIDTLKGVGSCDTIVTIHVFASPLEVKTENINLCSGENIVISGTTYSQPGTILDTIQGSVGCDTIVKYMLTRSDTEILLEDSITILSGLSVTLSPTILPSSGAQVAWSPTIYLDKNTVLNPLSSPKETIKYYLTVTDTFGCIAMDSILIRVRIPDCGYIYVPNIFSPNDDGINDGFTIFTNSECISNIKLLRIYDRWGNLIFEKFNFPPNDDLAGWDGAFRKKQVNPGVFLYYAELETYLGSVQKKYGAVTLIR